jgi:hypothetical protein
MIGFVCHISKNILILERCKKLELLKGGQNESRTKDITTLYQNRER